MAKGSRIRPKRAPVEERVRRAKGSVTRTGRIVAPETMSAQIARIGGALNPVEVSARIRSADLGRMRELQDLGNEARQKDCHLQGILSTREDAVGLLEWDMVLPPKPTKKEKKAAELVKDALKDIYSGLATNQAGARFAGYAVSETMWMKSGKYIVPECFYPVRARRFNIDRETLCLWDPGDPLPGIDLRSEFPGKFVISTPRTNGDVLSREGLIRPLLWAALFRNWTIADWLKLAELTWKPWRRGVYKKGAEQEEIDDLIAILQNMVSTGVAVHSDAVQAIVEWPTNSSNGRGAHPELAAMLAAEMSKCVLGQTLTTEQGTKGTQALGTVHEGVKDDKKRADARYISLDAYRDVVVPMTAMNFGPNVRPSVPAFVTDDSVDLAAFSLGVKNLVSAGTRIGAQWVREQAGIPEPKDGEEVLSIIQPAAASGDGTTPADGGGDGGGSDGSKPASTPNDPAASQDATAA